MMTYRLTRRARRDLISIWRHIAEDNEAAADRFIDLLTHHFRLLDDAPFAGRRRDELRARLLQLSCRRIPDTLSRHEAWRMHHARGARSAQS